MARAIRLDKKNEDAQWLLREMRRCDDPVESNSYELLIHGPWRGDVFPEARPALGFFTQYQVVAQDLDEALTFIREFEPKEIHNALKIDEVLAQDRCLEPKGVYGTSGYSFYEEE